MVWILVCKRMCLDGQYFIVVFLYENWNLAVVKTGKKLLYSDCKLLFFATIHQIHVVLMALINLICYKACFLSNF